jgi:hypothetical protein
MVSFVISDLLLEMDISMVDSYNGDSEILWWYSFVYIWKCSGKLYTPQKGSRQLKPFDSALVLQYGSGLSPLTSWPKYWVLTLHYFFLIQHFYFLLFSLFVRKSHKCRLTYIVRNSSVHSVFAYGAGSWGWITSEVIFLVTMTIMTLQATTFHLLNYYIYYW